MSRPPIKAIDALLPQTQCGLCDYDGCLPYAKALVKDGERIDRCPPGGTDTLRQLGKALGIDPAPYLEGMAAKAKPMQLAHIRENACIGCTKCLPVCPTDAIVGGPKHLHTVLTDACTGCGLCLPPCPMDCIDLLPQPTPLTSEKKDVFRARHKQHQARLAKTDAAEHQDTAFNALPVSDRQTAIRDALSRVQKKKSHVS